MKINVEKIEKQLEATLAVENKKPSVTGKKITRKFLEGEITSKEAVEKIKKYWKVKI
jgi:hypothetical protein